MIGVRKVWLLACPFCGGKAVLENYIMEAAAFCTVCNAKIVRRHTPKVDTGIRDAQRAWNTRTADKSSEVKP